MQLVLSGRITFLPSGFVLDYISLSVILYKAEAFFHTCSLFIDKDNAIRFPIVQKF